MRILITGGAGFIGSHIAEACLAANHEVAILDDLSTGRRENVPDGARLAVVDLRDADAVEKLVGEFKPEVVSHQGAQTSVSVSTREPIRDAQVNVVGSLGLLEACVKHNVGRVVFASTGGAIYGEIPHPERAAEDHATVPLSPYACAKLAVESYFPFYAAEHGLKTNVLRYANVYGPRQDPHGEAGVVAIFSRRLLAGEPIQINAMREDGDDGCVRDYVYVADVVRANMRAAEAKLPYDRINVCTGEATSTHDLASRLVKLTESSSVSRPGPRRSGDLERSVLDPSRCAELGPITSMNEGLARTVEWFRSH